MYGLANIKSAKKRILVAETRAARNKAIKSEVKTAIKKVDAAIAAKDVETAKANLRAAIATMNKATSKGVYHKNTNFQKDLSFNQGCKQHRLTFGLRYKKAPNTVSWASFF